MDPNRVHAYLQAACAGLGFDVGEVWWTEDENGSSSLAAIEENHGHPTFAAGDDGTQQGGRKFQFVQLYTSKSYENRRAELVNPPEASKDDGENRRRPQKQDAAASSENLKDHVLSPRLVDAISRTTQVIWATTKKQEGLTGRSDIPLQTAVGMPVAVDEDGNMCIVVMFSPNNIQTSDEAMEYLQSISQSATSTNIPCLLPVFASHTKRPSLSLLANSRQRAQRHVPASDLGDGVHARFVSLDDEAVDSLFGNGLLQDTVGVPMLQTAVEEGQDKVSTNEKIEVFDDATFGIWSTVMDSKHDPMPGALSSMTGNALEGPDAIARPDPSMLGALPPPGRVMFESRMDRLNEFCEAFLEMSAFDYADVWVPATESGYDGHLRYLMSTMSDVRSSGLNKFRAVSELAFVKFGRGAVGQAYSSGIPVWSTIPKVFVGAARSDAFKRSGIRTVMAVPIFAKGSSTPACVVACYSLVQSCSIPFVLRFVQQALHLLWQGIGTIETECTVDQDIWKDLAAADLGEMAADLEMQQHFMSKKRSHIHMANGILLDGATNLLTAELYPVADTIAIPLQLPDCDMILPCSVETIQYHMAQALHHINNIQPFDHRSISAPPLAKRQHLSSKTLNDSIGEPFPQIRDFSRMSQALSTAIASDSCIAPHGGSMSVAIAQPLPAAHSGDTFSRAASNQLLNTFDVQAMEPLAHLRRSQGSEGLSASKEFPSAYCLPVQVDQQVIYAQEPASITGAAAIVGSMNECRIDGCNAAAVPRRSYCEDHSGKRMCEVAGCGKCAQGPTRFCISHNGGRRCTYPGCDKGARGKYFCVAHGGGPRCTQAGCSKSAVGGSKLCTNHGGGRRCAVDGCDKSAQSPTNFCVKHGGGKTCVYEGCLQVARGRSTRCAKHGGGDRCKLDGCNSIAIGRMQLCRKHGGTSSRSRKPAPDLGKGLLDLQLDLNQSLPNQQQPSSIQPLSPDFVEDFAEDSRTRV